MSELESQQPSGQEALSGRRAAPDNGETGSPLQCGVGKLLRNERERKGLGYDEISEMTRIRPYILQALEAEDWACLPSTIFVKGFIRSYARALELAEDEVVARCENVLSVEPAFSKPREEPVRSRKALLPVLTILLITLGAAYYLWENHLAGENRSLSEQKAMTRDLAESSESGRTAPSESKPAVRYSQKKPTLGKELETVPSATRQEATKELKPANLVQSPEFVRLADVGGPLKDEERSSAHEESASSRDPETPLAALAPEITLKADVVERTWIKIFVDGQDPKEFIFPPGSHPEWKAREGFELLIGNAGGINLELNGQKIKKLGTSGQVVRLSLPEGYKSRVVQD